jgi:gas vesicle protein
MTLRFLFGLMIGLMIGASIALALAPQPGSTTRHKLWEKVKERTPTP